MKILGLQHDIVWEDPTANFVRVKEQLSAARPEPGTLVVLPEMFGTGFTMNAALAEQETGPTSQFLSNLAREHQVGIVAGVALVGADGLPRNCAVAFSSAGEQVSSYAKMRPFNPGGEGKSYAAGRQVVAFRSGEWTISPFICYDLRFPELFRTAAALHRPDLFVVIANFPARRADQWRLMLQARAIENQAWVIGVNRVGSDPVAVYAGHSLIANPYGQIVAEAGETQEILRWELDLQLVRDYRRNLPFLDDMGTGWGRALQD